jgi:CRP-like cAMP-binding protein
MRLDDEVGWFQRIPLLSQMEPEALRLLAFAAERQQYRAGDMILRKGQPVEAGYLVIAGQVAMHEHDDGRAPSRIVAPGGLIGELALLTTTEAAATAIAREPVTILRVGRAVMQRVLREFPDSADQLRRGITMRLSSMNDELGPIREALLAIDQP